MSEATKADRQRPVLSTEGLGAVSEALCCPECDDGDGNCVFPHYGVAPHTHALPTPAHPTDWRGSTQLLPRDQWGGNFREDEDSPGHLPALRLLWARHMLLAPNVRAKLRP